MKRILFLSIILALAAANVVEAKRNKPSKAKVSQQQEVVAASQNGESAKTAQNDTPTSIDNTPVVAQAQIMPTFMGGDLMTFRNWVQSRLKYPVAAQRNGIQGTVMVCFVVEIDGSLSEIKILQSPDPSLSQEVMRVVKSAPNKWKPGRQNGEKVRVRMVAPFSFRTRQQNVW